MKNNDLFQGILDDTNEKVRGKLSEYINTIAREDKKTDNFISIDDIEDNLETLKRETDKILTECASKVLKSLEEQKNIQSKKVL